MAKVDREKQIATWAAARAFKPELLESGTMTPELASRALDMIHALAFDAGDGGEAHDMEEAFFTAVFLHIAQNTCTDAATVCRIAFEAGQLDYPRYF